MLVAHAVLLERSLVAGGDVALVRREVVLREPLVHARMMRSRVTFATTDAAAMLPDTRSPFHSASPGAPSPATGKPSVRT